MSRATGRVWLHDWNFLRDLDGGSTDAKGWSYHVLADRYADTGVTGKAQVKGLNVHRARGRVWFRVAATPSAALEVEVRKKQPVPHETALLRRAVFFYDTNTVDLGKMLEICLTLNPNLNPDHLRS